MTHAPLPPGPDNWLQQAFSSTTAAAGGVIKRQVSDVERIVGRERFLGEVRRRGFQAIENGNTMIVFCNGDPVRLASPKPHAYTAH